METSTDPSLMEYRFSLLRALASAERALNVNRADFAFAVQHAIAALHHTSTLRTIARIVQPQLRHEERALMLQLQRLGSDLLRRVAASPSVDETERALRVLLGALEPPVIDRQRPIVSIVGDEATRFQRAS